MRRIESQGPSSIPTNAPPEAAAPAPKARAKPTPRPARSNEVRAYDGPPAAPARGPKTQEPAGAGAAVSAGELAALGGRTRPVAAEVPQDVYERIQGRLTRSWKDWAITETDMRAVHDALEKLPPGEYRATLERMERDGLLRAFVDRLEVGTRWAFLEQAERKGVVKRQPGEPASGPCDPPASPDLFVNDKALPPSLSDAVSLSCIDAERSYYVSFGRYIQRYEERVAQARSGADLRALGPPKESRIPDTQPGLWLDHPRYEHFDRRWRDEMGGALQFASNFSAQQAVNRRIDELTGQQSPGTFWLSAEVEVNAGAAKFGRELKLHQDGKSEMAHKGGVVVGGEVEGRGKNAGVKYSAESNTKGESKTVAEAEVAGFGLAADSEGELEMKVKLAKAAGGYAKANPRTAEVGGGFAIGFEGEKVSLETKLGMGAKLLPPEVARQALDPNFPGPQGVPKELEKGIPWERLSPERQALFRSLDWTPQEWADRLAR
jgi:hypothetical protein